MEQGTHAQQRPRHARQRNPRKRIPDARSGKVGQDDYSSRQEGRTVQANPRPCAPARDERRSLPRHAARPLPGRKLQAAHHAAAELAHRKPAHAGPRGGHQVRAPLRQGEAQGEPRTAPRHRGDVGAGQPRRDFRRTPQGAERILQAPHRGRCHHLDLQGRREDAHQGDTGHGGAEPRRI